jgi:hypothetical protein
MEGLGLGPGVCGNDYRFATILRMVSRNQCNEFLVSISLERSS